MSADSPIRVNDEEPSLDAMDRLWDALDAALDPPAPTDPTADPSYYGPDRQGSHACLRCGHHWTPRKEGRPRCCPWCRSAYWDAEPKLQTARVPWQTDWRKVRFKADEARLRRKQYHHLAQVKKLAKELGLDVTDPRTGRPLTITRRLPSLLIDIDAPQLTKVEARKAADPTITPRQPSVTPPASFRRTVPPPPGIEDER